MSYRRLISNIVLGVLLVGRLGVGGTALAVDTDSSPSPSPVASESPSPSPSPSLSPSPSPSESPAPSVSPEPSASPSPSATPQATASPSPSASPSASPEPAIGVDKSQTGPGECTGVIPEWVFDTTVRKWTAADKGSFSCDMASGLWLSPKYFYDKRIGWYEIIPAEAPKPDYMVTAPNVIHTELGDMVVGSKDYEVAKALGLLDGPGGIVVSGTGSGSTNQASVQNTDKSWIDLTNIVNVINTLQSAAASGGVAASSNTQVGSSTSGAASVLANVINLLASAWSWSNGGLSFFMHNFFGDHNGDITLAPTQVATGGGGQLGGSASIAGTGSDSTNTANLSNSSTLDVKAQSTGNIVNNLDVGALSGNASATGNTSAGNVASGNATAEVNIINLINSLIASGNSFFGILNIFGHFNGDILFPSGFLNSATPSATGGGSAAAIAGTGPGSTNQAGISGATSGTFNNSSSQSATNNINTQAASGGVGANANTSAGSLTSGAASTTQSLFNLSNTAIFGDNAVLVLVNVLGHWVGKIMNISGNGTQSALLTGNATVGINGTGADSTNQAQVSNSATANVDQKSVGTITNNVNVKAVSGDATASKNTKVGDISSGDAKAASSVANIFNSVLNVKHWFGVLVINVFGDWLGNVNDDSTAGDEATETSGSTARGTGEALPRVFAAKINPSAAVQAQSTDGGSVAGDSTASNHVDTPISRVLTAAATHPADTAVASAAKANDTNWLFGLSAIMMLIAGALAAMEKRQRGAK